METILWILSPPLFLVGAVLIARLFFAKAFTPLVSFFYGNVHSDSQENSGHNITSYDSSIEYKGILVFMVAFSTCGVVTGSYGWRGPGHAVAICLLGWYIFLFNVYRVRIIDDQKLVYYRVLKMSAIKIQDIYKIEEGIRYLRVYHNNGTLYLDNFIAELPELCSRIKSLKPEITTKCLSLKTLHKDWWGWGAILNFVHIAIVWLIIIYLIISYAFGFFR